MKLWMLTGTASGYDTYDALIVAAPTEEKAKMILPSESYSWDDKWRGIAQVWADHPGEVKATLIGTAAKGTPQGLILASFNAR